MAPLRRSLRDARGLTLTEVVVVMVIGTLIMAGIVGFYLSSQGVWLDSSTQVITQREASLVASAIRDRVRQSAKAEAFPVPDSLHWQLALFSTPDAPAPDFYFWWNTTDSLIYSGESVGGAGSGPMGFSRADRFKFSATNENVRMDLRLVSASGEGVEISAFAVFRN